MPNKDQLSDKDIKIAHVISKLRGYARSNNITKTAISTMSGLSKPTTKKFWSDDWNPTKATIIKIETAFAKYESK